MSAARAVLDAFVALLSAAGDPVPVAVGHGGGDDGTEGADRVTVGVLALERVGRSHRRGAVLDLCLVVDVAVAGPAAVETAERLLVALERGPGGAATSPVAVAYGPGVLGFTARLPVAVPLDEPTPPLVTQPPVVEVGVADPIVGRLVDAQGRGISGAVVRSASSGTVVTTGEGGGFRLLAAGAAVEVLVVQVRTETRRVEAHRDRVPLVVVWPGDGP